jgi:hypothetical protein
MPASPPPSNSVPRPRCAHPARRTHLRGAVLLSCIALASCARTPTAPDPRAGHGRDHISLEQALAMITAGEAKQVFQPHEGCVLLVTRDGRWLSFDQPHLDWILRYVVDNGLRDRLDELSTE